MNRLNRISALGSVLLVCALGVNAQTPPAKPSAAQTKALAAEMKECVTREQAKGDVAKDAATLTCREAREAEQLKELGPHSSSETTVNSPAAPAAKMSASGHSSHSGNSGTEPSNTIQESKNTVIDKPY